MNGYWNPYRIWEAIGIDIVHVLEIGRNDEEWEQTECGHATVMGRLVDSDSKERKRPEEDEEGAGRGERIQERIRR